MDVNVAVKGLKHSNKDVTLLKYFNRAVTTFIVTNDLLEAPEFDELYSEYRLAKYRLVSNRMMECATVCLSGCMQRRLDP